MFFDGPGGTQTPQRVIEAVTAQGVLRFLAVAGGHRSPEVMARTWPEGDRWWRVGEEPAAPADTVTPV